MTIRKIRPEDDAAIAEIVRRNLKKYGLDLPGTVYFDEGLDHLSEFYLSSEKRGYYVAVDEEGAVAGGIGLAEFGCLDQCAELQKLYLADRKKGCGFGYRLIDFIIQKARQKGYARIYLETHSNLKAAIHMYEKSGFREIERLPECVHAAMDRFYLREL